MLNHLLIVYVRAGLMKMIGPLPCCIGLQKAVLNELQDEKECR
jgi:hypothetical protein